MSKERELRKSLEVPDTFGFGALRGILTGNTEQIPEYFVVDSVQDSVQDAGYCSHFEIIDALRNAERQSELAKNLYDYYVDRITDPHISTEETNRAWHGYHELMPKLDLTYKHHEAVKKLAFERLGFTSTFTAKREDKLERPLIWDEGPLIWDEYH